MRRFSLMRMAMKCLDEKHLNNGAMERQDRELLAITADAFEYFNQGFASAFFWDSADHRRPERDREDTIEISHIGI